MVGEKETGEHGRERKRLTSEHSIGWPLLLLLACLLAFSRPRPPPKLLPAPAPLPLPPTAHGSSPDAKPKHTKKNRASLAAHLESQPWGDKSQRPFLSREEEYVGALRAALGIWQQMRSGELSYDDAVLARKLVNMPSGFELHIGVRELGGSLSLRENRN